MSQAEGAAGTRKTVKSLEYTLNLNPLVLK